MSPRLLKGSRGLHLAYPVWVYQMRLRKKVEYVTYMHAGRGIFFTYAGGADRIVR